jgi:8-oxo-dGTP pyrophosphatase MutT (NUDIX family)
VSADALDPQWLAALNASASQPPLRERFPFYLGPHRIGSVEADYLGEICLNSTSDGRDQLQKEEHPEGLRWRLSDVGGGTAALQRMAQALLAARVGCVPQQWRNEQLAVCDSQGQPLASVERALVRPLGIATRAVHLVGRGTDGRYWLQQRAFTKANDPGLWDTLMGGMVSASDTVQTALARETWEEAGIHLDALVNLRWGGQVELRKPSSEDRAGYVVEQSNWYHGTVPDQIQPQNQDGEVAQFELLDRRQLMERLQRNEFTTEAALILVAALRLP